MTQTRETFSADLGVSNGEDALAVLKHPDDEYMFGGALELFRISGVTVHAVVATDGEKSDRGDPVKLRNGYRRHEARRALAQYGIHSENQHFLGLPDGEIDKEEHGKALHLAIGRLLIKHTICTVITLGHYGYDNHTDHIAGHHAAYQAALEYSTVNPELRLYGLTHDETGIRIPVDPSIKLARLSHHESQFEIDLSDPTYKPAPNTIERPGIRISPVSQAYLARYSQNMEIERYEQYSLDSH